MTEEMITHFHLYTRYLKETTKIFKCFIFLLSLNNGSTEADFRMAISAINNLKKMASSDPILKQIIKIDNDIIQSSAKNFYNLYTHEDSPLSTISWKTLCMLGLLSYDLSEGQQRKNSCLNILAGIGTLLFRFTRSSINYPADLINEILPKIDDII